MVWSALCPSLFRAHYESRMCHSDSYLLRNGYNDNGGWELIGTEDENKVTKYDVSPEKKPKLAEYMSYDELIISAMCGISSPTHFINCGSRSFAVSVLLTLPAAEHLTT